MELQKKESKKKAVDTSKSDGDDYDVLSKRTQTKSTERKCQECTEEKKGSISILNVLWKEGPRQKLSVSAEV